MPYFQPRHPETVEAYRLPLEGDEPSDGLVFFMEKIGFEDGDAYTDIGDPGDWIVRKPDGRWRTMNLGEFLAIYEPLE